VECFLKKVKKYSFKLMIRKALSICQLYLLSLLVAFDESLSKSKTIPTLVKKKNMKLNSNPEVKKRINSYPKAAAKKLNHLRKIILATAKETEGITAMEETLKWGEPSYLVKKGSTIRMDWKEKKPDQYAVYFKCTSKLVNTFKEVYKDTFKYETTRAIVFGMEDDVPEEELKNCIRMALTYHKVKHLPLLGAAQEDYK